jgi:hypothetical protein
MFTRVSKIILKIWLQNGYHDQNNDALLQRMVTSDGSGKNVRFLHANYAFLERFEMEALNRR